MRPSIVIACYFVYNKHFEIFNFFVLSSYVTISAKYFPVRPSHSIIKYAILNQVFQSLVRQFETFSYSNLSFRKFNFLWLLTTFIISLMSGNVLIFFFICYSKLSLSNLSLTSFPLLFRPLRFSNILLCRALQS